MKDVLHLGDKVIFKTIQDAAWVSGNSGHLFKTNYVYEIESIRWSVSGSCQEISLVGEKGIRFYAHRVKLIEDDLE